MGRQMKIYCDNCSKDIYGKDYYTLVINRVINGKQHRIPTLWLCRECFLKAKLNLIKDYDAKKIYTKLEQIKNAMIEELADRWWHLYEDTQRLSEYINHYYEDEIGDCFDSRDIADFKKNIKKNEKEMSLIEQTRPEVIDYMFGNNKDKNNG